MTTKRGTIGKHNITRLVLVNRQQRDRETSFPYYNQGAALAGVRENRLDRVVNFQLDNALVNASALQAMKAGAGYIREAVSGVDTLKPLPADYFTISDNSRTVIRAGTHMGAVVIKADSAKFLKDAARFARDMPFRSTLPPPMPIPLSKRSARPSWHSNRRTCFSGTTGTAVLQP